ncbi:MAG: hypothetical protein L6R40_000952 [Gallowayella cf. fulva]|nr:MAG: hypothetical protein L6R40_000952 [Xanthomendoza cf. fulva]
MLPYNPHNYRPLPVRKDNHSHQESKHDPDPSSFAAPITPCRAVPNTSKKRKGPDLSRSTPTSSHHDSISAIFDHVGRALQSIPSPRPLSANARKIRMPLATNDSVRKALAAKTNVAQESMCGEDSPDKENSTPNDGYTPSSPTPLRSSYYLPLRARSYGDRSLVGYLPEEPQGGAEPTSSGFNSPVGDPSDTKVVYSDLTPFLPTHHRLETAATPEGVLTSPKQGVETWLDQIPNYDSPEGIQNPPNSPATSVKSLSLPQRAVASKADQSPASRSRFLHPLSPRGYLSSPPKRKISRLSPGRSDQQFDIYEDEPLDAIAELSPAVEKYRKGRGPRRERCVSYWDDDILPAFREKPAVSDLPDYVRQPLGELPSLTEAKGFVDGVENALFDFEIELADSRA